MWSSSRNKCVKRSIAGRLAFSVVLLAVSGVAAPAHSAVPTCFGVRATYVGTSGPDQFAGSSGRDVIVGLGGDDVLYGMGGNDLICGGPGMDTPPGPTRDIVTYRLQQASVRKEEKPCTS